MALRGNLFIKMFIAFWLVTVSVLGSWMLSSNYFESHPRDLDISERKPTAPPHRFILRTIYNLQNLEGRALEKAVEEVQKKHNVEIYLINKKGKDLLGRPVSSDVRRAANKLRGGRRRAFVKTPQGHLTAHVIYSPHQGPLRAVFVLPSHRGTLLDALGGSVSLRIGIAVFISGIVCFGLSRLMTSRLKELQLASRRLANGDLDTRLQVRNQGGDETDELARDFNSMAEQLQDRIQAQKRMLGDVSHELRSPLARLRIALALAQEKPDNVQAYMQRIEQEAERLEELIGQLLAVQVQDIVLDSHIDLVPLLKQLCADTNFEGQGAGKEFTFSTDTEQAIVDSSGDLLRKSFENILRNALHHTAANSRVNVALNSTDKCYHITIEDQGPGVPENDLDNIFNTFYRVDTARTRESGGYGLGLAIAKRAIAQHGGEVTARNTNRGLEISVHLPQHY